MSTNSATSGRKFSLGQELGRALAVRLVDLARPGATIIDNSEVIVDDRRRSAKRPPGAPGLNRRRTDIKTADIKTTE